MILPSNERCVQIMKDLVNDPALTEWEQEFLESNLWRREFTDRQKEVFAKLQDEYEL